MSLTIDVFDYPGRIEECFSIRRRVFIDEQDVTEREEIDGLDPECVHLLAELDGLPVGTARLRDGGAKKAKAERVAVLREYRRSGVGRALMLALEDEAGKRGFEQVFLGAQLSALDFYESSGYVMEGEEFLDARIRHRWMRKKLTQR